MADFLRIYRSHVPDYLPTAGCEASTREDLIKEAVASLPEADRAVLVVYSEIRSTKRLGEMLGITKQTAWRMVCAIRKQVLKEYDKRRNDL